MSVKTLVILAPHCQVSDLLPIGCLVVGDQAYHCFDVGKPHDGVGKLHGVGIMLGLQSLVNREYKRGLSTHP
jgi:hypothetical protein